MKRVCSSAAAITALFALATAPTAQNGNILSVLDVQKPTGLGILFAPGSEGHRGVASFFNLHGRSRLQP